ncbi:MAG TPA: amidohydrolase family protein [Casimicrobiaceae bacterium]|nr:amidohydrolase family protein [Casimicrobiaceae bacterium]
MTAAPTAAHRIDVHHHLFPPAYVAALAERQLAQRPALDWSPGMALEDMDRAGIACAMTSITAPGLAFLGGEPLRRMARECNDYAADLARAHPTRFGVFAMLPLPDVDASLAEIAYAFDTLRVDGIGLLTSYHNRWLGDPAFAPVMDELDRRGALAYVHPTAPDCCRNLIASVPDWVIEFPADTMRTITSLLFSGTVRRCPRIRFIFSHTGGILTILRDHLVRAASVNPSLAAALPDGVIETLHRFHYDTALRAHREALDAAVTTLGVERLLLGTDAPFRKCSAQIESLLAYGFGAHALHAIERGNAERLMPRWRM